MDLVALARIALRRWKILVPLLLLSAGIGWLAATAVAPTYQVDGAIRVSYPFSTDSGVAALVQSNPFYDTDSAALVLGRVGGSVDLTKAVVANGGTAEYIIDGSTGRSILTITVTGPDEQEALRTHGVVVRELADRLDRLQADKDIPSPYRITADDVVKPQNALISNSSRTKVLIASMALGMILSIGVCLIADHRLRRRLEGTGDDAMAAVAEPAAAPSSNVDEKVSAESNGRGTASRRASVERTDASRNVPHEAEPVLTPADRLGADRGLFETPDPSEFERATRGVPAAGGPTARTRLTKNGSPDVPTLNGFAATAESTGSMTAVDAGPRPDEQRIDDKALSREVTPSPRPRPTEGTSGGPRPTPGRRS